MAEDTKSLETLDWYRQAGNWLVGLSTGAIATGLLLGKEIKAASPKTQGFFMLAGVCFLATILFGMYYYFWILKYGGAKALKWEFEERLHSAVTSGTPLPVAEETKLQNEVKAKEKVMEKGKKIVGLLLFLLLVFFPGGALLAAVGVLELMIQNPKIPGKFLVLSVAGDSTAGVQRNPTTLLLSETDGRTWELVGDEPRSRFWRCIPRVPVITADSCGAPRPDPIPRPPPKLPIKKDN